jgi:hypothetical protein
MRARLVADRRRPIPEADCQRCQDTGAIGAGTRLDACPDCAARAEAEWRVRKVTPNQLREERAG